MFTIVAVTAVGLVACGGPIDCGSRVPGGHLVAIAADHGDQRWSVTLDGEPSAPVSIGTVVVADVSSAPSTPRRAVAWDVASGRQLWELPLGEAPRPGDDEPPLVAGGSFIVTRWSDEASLRRGVPATSSPDDRVPSIRALGEDGSTRWERLGAEALAIDLDGAVLARHDGRIESIDSWSGRVRWQVVLEADDVQVIGDLVVVASGPEETPTELVGLDAVTGRPRWRTASPASVTTIYPPPPMSTPSVVVVLGPRKPGGYVVGLDPDSGTVRWRTAASAAVVADAEGVAMLRDLGTHAVDRDNGLDRWWEPFEHVTAGPDGVYGTQGLSTSGANANTPLTGMLLSGEGRDSVVAIDPGSGQPRWREDPRASGNPSADQVEDLWVRRGMVLVQDAVHLRALDPADGRRLWQIDRAYANQRMPILTSDTLVFADHQPTVGCL